MDLLRKELVSNIGKAEFLKPGKLTVFKGEVLL